MSKIFLKRVDHDKNYAIISLICVKDKRLSWGAKGLHLYLFSLAGIHGWELHHKNLLDISSDGEWSLRGKIKELKDAGYLQITAIRDKDGKFEQWRWEISETPKETKPYNLGKKLIKSASSGKPTSG